ncbi:hypothetical protein P4S72_04760 [Vibrio sp. PP-XX7]
MATTKSYAFTPTQTLTGIIDFLLASRPKIDARSESSKHISEGFYQMVNGLSAVLKGTEEKLNEMINSILDNEQSLLSDADLEAIESLGNMVSSIRPALGSEDALPDELRRLIARVIERGEMLKSLELQLRPYKGKVIHVQFDAEKLHQQVNENRSLETSGWDDE